MPTHRDGCILNALLVVAIAVLCGGCASGPNKADPWEKTNRFLYNVNDGFDRVALKPVSDAYVNVVPKPIRTGIGNGFNNLTYLNVIVNDLLQGKWNQGLGDSGRMGVNSTIGIAGFFDVATNFGLPEHQNDFGITLAGWGAEPGPYLVLPLFGPSTVRDAPGLAVEYLATPTSYLDLPFAVTFPLAAVDVVNSRSNAELLMRFRNDTALDPYVFTRDAYLQYRESRIHDGKIAGPDQSIYDTDTGPPETPAAPRR